MTMTRKLFGTDGIRGRANLHPMTPEIAMRLGMAVAAHFGREGKIVVGKDTRRSGYMLEMALASGLCALGVDVLLVGPIPTPGIAYLAKSMRADAGVVISASHNSFEDNGFKLFANDGFKLPDEVESHIETLMEPGVLDERLATGESIGKAKRIDDAGGRYITYVKQAFPLEHDLEGLRIVVDCAHGAAYKIAPAVLAELGADVIQTGVAPNGTNINAGVGAMYPEHVAHLVREYRADFGLALDGDADRAVVCDHRGELIDGDIALAILGRDFASRGLLRGSVVATVMSNIGLERSLSAAGIGLERTAVGDRYVVEAMRRHGLNIGGEQSGHIVLSDFATTGDGLIAALQVLAVLIKSGKPASETSRVFQPLPQLLKNVRFQSGGKPPLDQASVKAAIAAGEAALNSSGRLLIRKSGTEPLIRVMAEGEDEKLVARVVDDIVAAVEAAAR